MRRRAFALGFISLPLAAFAQRGGRVRRIGALINLRSDDPEGHIRLQAFRAAMRDLSWVEGQNYVIDFRWASGDSSQLVQGAEELIASKPDLVLTHTTAAMAAVARRTQSIPVVFLNVSDPISEGYVTSYAKPGGNVTGFTNIEF